MRGDTMTEERLVLAELLEKAGDGDFLRTVAEAVLQLLMETDVEGLIGAGRYERTGERTTWRNGHRDRALDTRLGSLQLRIPKRGRGYFWCWVRRLLREPPQVRRGSQQPDRRNRAAASAFRAAEGTASARLSPKWWHETVKMPVFGRPAGRSCGSLAPHGTRRRRTKDALAR